MKIPIFLFLLNSCIAFSQSDVGSRQRLFNLEEGVAIQGYDPVSYFKQNKAQEGSKKIS